MTNEYSLSFYLLVQAMFLEVLNFSLDTAVSPSESSIQVRVSMHLKAPLKFSCGQFCYRINCHNRSLS